MFDWSKVTYAWSGDATVSQWPQTSLLERVAVELRLSGDDRVTLQHSARHAWPVVNSAEWGAINGSAWAFLPRSNGTWRAGTYDQLRQSLTEKGMERAYGKSYALDFDDSYRIAPGDLIGYMVSARPRG